MDSKLVKFQVRVSHVLKICTIAKEADSLDSWLCKGKYNILETSNACQGNTNSEFLLIPLAVQFAAAGENFEYDIEPSIDWAYISDLSCSDTVRPAIIP